MSFEKKYSYSFHFQEHLVTQISNLKHSKRNQPNTFQQAFEVFINDESIYF